MTCDATVEDLRAGDDLVWDYTTTDNVSAWSSPVVKFRDGPTLADSLLASSEAGDITGDVGEVELVYDFAAGEFQWAVPADVSREWAGLTVWMHVRVLDDGVDSTVWPPTAYYVGAEVADRAAGS